MTRSHTLVALQFLVLLAWAGSGSVLCSHPVGRLIQLAGVGLGVWAVWTLVPGRFNVTPEPRSEASLQRGGPYRLVRHPMYACLIYTVVPPTFAPGPVWRVALAAGLVLVLLAKIRLEEHFLHRAFAEYGEFARTRRRLIPWIY